MTSQESSENMLILHLTIAQMIYLIYRCAFLKFFELFNEINNILPNRG